MKKQLSVGAAGSKGDADARRKICLVTSEIEGLTTNGGIGSVVLRFAQMLSGQGVDVEILYTLLSDGRPFVARGHFAHHVENLSRMGIRLTALADSRSGDELGQSFEVLQYLLAEQFDAVFFNDLGGIAYYSLLARKTGNAVLKSTRMHVFLHGVTQWVHELNGSPIRSLGSVTVAEMERRSVELADTIIAPSSYIVEKYRTDYGWKLPRDTIVLPNLMLWDDIERGPTKPKTQREIAFFGRLENRKGLWMFCAALDALRRELVGRKVAFLGKPVMERGISTERLLVHRASGWPCEVSIVTQLDREQAISYLIRHGLIAVLPAPEDNSPSVVLECLANRISFVASTGGGGKELVDEASREANFFEPTVAALTDRLRNVLADGCAPSTPSFEPGKVRQFYYSKIRELLVPVSAEAAKAGPKINAQIVAVVPHDIAGDQLASAARNILNIHHLSAEVTFVSSDPGAISRELLMGGLTGYKVRGIQDFGQHVESLRKRKDLLLGLCHLSQPISKEFIERTRGNFLRHGTLATSGMATGQKLDVQEEVKLQRPSRFLFGPSPTLNFLSRLTNSGFAVFHVQAFEELAKTSPVHPDTQHLKSMQDWIHEIFCRLTIAGKKADLIPDVVASGEVPDSPSEIFYLGQTLRTLFSADRRYAAGSDQHLLARLAMESAQHPLREAAHAECIRQVAGLLRGRVNEGNTFGHGGFSEIVAFAGASGHVEVAADLMVRAAFPEISPDAGVEEVIKIGAAAIRLFDLALANRDLKKMNLQHHWSYKLVSDEREIELHPNIAHEGRATLEFPSLDLGKTQSFQCKIALPSSTAKSVRFRVDVIAVDGEAHFTTDRVLRPSQDSKWEFDLPASVRCTARVLLSVEASDPSTDPVHSYTRWRDPSFTRAMERSQ